MHHIYSILMCVYVLYHVVYKQFIQNHTVAFKSHSKYWNEITSIMYICTLPVLIVLILCVLEHVHLYTCM